MDIVQKIEELDDYRSNLMLIVDGKKVFDVYDGEPEDNNLFRNFNDCFKIVGLMEAAYQAGIKGEGFNLSTVDTTQ